MFSSTLESRSKADEELVMRCVQRRHFGKDKGGGSYRYHPLALDVVGKQLGCMDPKTFWMLHCIVHIFVVMLDIRSITGFAKQPDLSEVGDRAIRESLKVVFPNEVGFLTRLQYLVLRSYSGAELPASSRLILLCEAIFCNCNDGKALTGLSSKLGNLQVPNLGNCRELRSCPEELESLHNIGRFRNLRILKVSGCPLVHEVPGLGEPGALERLHAGMEHWKPSSWLRSPDMRKLRSLNDRRCLMLRGWNLRTWCPICEIRRGPFDVAVHVDGGRQWMWRAVGTGGLVLALGWIVWPCGRSRACEH